MYNTATLDNGLRIIQRPSDGDVVYCGYAIKAGTRDETAGEEGLAHFCEHASFKGTTRRKGWQIIQTLEGLGGELNAYTNKESTVYYCAILREHLPRAIDLLTDMVFHSVFPEHELEKEKEVICDEIESYNDSPGELIFDEFENIIFDGHPLGHNILGTKESVRGFTSADALRFTRRHYRPSNAIFFIYGSPSHVSPKGDGLQPVVSELSKAFRHYPTDIVPDDTPRTPAPGKATPPAADTTAYHQAHVLTGRRAYGISHPRRIALYLLNNILGGPGMNAKLNLALREHNGLVYTVESTMVAYGDTGTWNIYFGCDEHDVKRCLRLVRKEVDKFMEKRLSDAQLRAAKKQIKGQIGVACDNRENFALDFGKSFLHYGWEKNVDRLYEQVDAITAQQMQAVAQELFDEHRLTTLIFK